MSLDGEFSRDELIVKTCTDQMAVTLLIINETDVNGEQMASLDLQLWEYESRSHASCLYPSVYHIPQKALSY